MERKISFLITSLDKGYVVSKNNKTEAFENSLSVEAYVLSQIKKQIERFSYTGVVHNMHIQVTVDENVPSSVEDNS